MGISDIEERRLKASRPVITPSLPTSCRCRYVTLRFRTKNICRPETLERATRVKRLIGRPRKLCSVQASRQLQSAQSERKSTTCFGEEPILQFPPFFWHRFCK
ncbi:hypothetical protein [Lysinibacillus sp. G4S2]|uniref:hypothetical protein n=1 Tax=Lysinibacillus sp. G4S2 TaxID=3055859 RepID=UPI0025A30B2C|nr:hypothetical protein [Lysinibacillus sp. G4S2]MDM5250526.1 hypothetical protein [Lysinibacillus sp. G4S2]